MFVTVLSVFVSTHNTTTVSGSPSPAELYHTGHILAAVPCVSDAWWHLNQIIYEYGDLFNEDPSRKISHETKIALIRKCEAIFRAFFDENDLGEYSFYLGQYNEFLAQEYAALHMEEETLTHLEKAIDGWTAYRNLPEQYEYRSVLYDQRPYSKPNVSGTYCDLSRLKDKLDRDETYSFLRRNYRFQELYKKLS